MRHFLFLKCQINPHVIHEFNGRILHKPLYGALVLVENILNMIYDTHTTCTRTLAETRLNWCVWTMIQICCVCTESFREERKWNNHSNGKSTHFLRSSDKLNYPVELSTSRFRNHIHEKNKWCMKLQGISSCPANYQPSSNVDSS